MGPKNDYYPYLLQPSDTVSSRPIPTSDQENTTVDTPTATSTSSAYKIISSPLGTSNSRNNNSSTMVLSKETSTSKNASPTTLRQCTTFEGVHPAKI
ncbi:unnamed protein product [Arabis nemorensis]|uniref:Uncharacterized protein n=1 Tax=Arabis nemorensis TaxID=586526 RepID=A0A565BR59_9BRAS|nr:unnamed protein product [Arabis nemorensis]